MIDISASSPINRLRCFSVLIPSSPVSHSTSLSSITIVVHDAKELLLHFLAYLLRSRHHHQVLPLIEKDSSVSNHSATDDDFIIFRLLASILKEFKKSNNEEVAVLSASRPASTVVRAANATEVSSNLLKLFEPRPPLEYRPPPEKRKCPPYTGMAQFVSHFAEPTDPEYAPPVVKGETPGQRRARIHWLRTNFEFITLTLSLWLTFVHFNDRYLSYNFCNGSIPESLGGLTSVRILNLNGNSLSGRVPAAVGGRLLHRSSFNFTDNKGLCGILGLQHFLSPFVRQ
uniref:U1 small nuclear ribonucleoprotein of 70kDa N-terminal domain-containing protein n=1 Tax=Lactuca sativa TaxID=4236 RepID=A0A9R1V7U0_LACSA|nr:hypothetical protein LSAT_V11C600319060 [Lactuca sativa]